MSIKRLFSILVLFICVFIAIFLFNKYTDKNEVKEINSEVKSDSSSITEPINKKELVKIPVLMYHTVNKENPNSTINIQPDNFENQIKAIKNAGYNSVTPKQLVDYYYNKGKLPDNPIFITFDDGYLDNYTNAYPILKKYETQATIFVIASRIVEENNLYPKEIPKFSWKQAEKMRDYITIQNHTWDSHKKIVGINGKSVGMISSQVLFDDGTSETVEEYEKRLYSDLKNAQEIIKNKMGYPSELITYPYGQYSDEVIKISKSLGLKLGFTVKNGVNYKDSDLFKLNRITVDGNYSGKKLVNIIKTTK